MNSNSLFLVGKTKERDDTAQQEQSGLWGQVGDCGEAPGGRCPPREPAGAAAWSPGRPTPREPAPQDIRPAWPGAGPPERGAWGAGCRCTQILESGGRGDMAASRDAEIWKDVQTYYGQVLKKSGDLQTSACVTTARLVPRHIQEALRNVHEEVTLRYYGCGLVIPECLENCWILDLGSGSGRDCYALSQLVGETGHVTGIDMTESQVEVAKKYIEYHMEKYGFQTPNVTFLHGYIEKLEEIGIKDESYDIVISNCVINLVPDKQAVLQEVYRVLKHGGELYFSDVYASLELPEEIRTHKILWGECLGGALYWKDLAVLAQKIGFCPPRLVTANLITVQNKELERVIGDCRFVSATFRLFKLPKTGPAERCQVIYNGGITGHEKELIFDANFTFKEGEIIEVDKETAAILKNSRFAKDFLIRPIGETLPTCSGCSALESKGIITDPFMLAGQSDSMKSRCSPDVAGGCCGITYS
ncbi:arsenite methyltransferase isoform X2 [Canis lupus baileyi]|uniref:Arsenite methyltransferase n=5 Tax=Canis lupus TaxID=9612 RepID=A0A8I3PZC9_CANLF|nr:arsenite methyltransferase isoform X2 [Canis lupus dingo]XP_038296362.1 arsenite methyltransferase isoform X2 [Canis lupus familiaris]